MTNTGIIMISIFIACLLLALSVLSFLSSHPRRLSLWSFPFLIILWAVAAITFCFYETRFDFINNPNQAALLTPLLVLSFAAALSFLPRCTIVQAVILSGAAVLLPLYYPAYRLVFYSGFPLWLNLILTSALWIIIIYAPRLYQSLPNLAAIEIITLGLGIFILSLFNAAPQLLGVCALLLALLSAASMLYNRQMQIAFIPSAYYNLWGFAAGWLIILASAEKLAPSIFCFTAVIIAELVYAVLKKLSFLPQFRTVSTNTFSADAFYSGLPDNFILHHVIRLNFVLLLLGSIEVFAPNAYSFPLISLVWVLWNMYRLLNWNQKELTFSETNRKVFDNIKTELNTLRDNFNRRK